MHLDPTADSARALLDRRIDGPFTMLNLLRLRDVADYRNAPHLAPATPISGHAAYDRYVAHTLPFLTASGGSLDFLGDGGALFVGPSEDRWDLAMMVRQSSVADFFAFASNEAYLAGAGHRDAAVEDARLLALVERPAIT